LGNQVRGYGLETGEWLRTNLSDADIKVTSQGPIRGAVTIRQALPGNVELVRHVEISLSNPLLECTTELVFSAPVTMGEKLIVGEFDIAGGQVVWPLPLQAGSRSCATDQAPPVIFSSQDALEVRTGGDGLRYMAHRATTRTYQYAAKPISQGLRLGLIASMPNYEPDPAQLSSNPGLGFPGHTYYGSYVYQYALHPVAPDAQTRTAFYNNPLLWSFYPYRQDIASCERSPTDGSIQAL
jgi:hypothetical protein